ncbi:MaoC family dehydratase N-terminal domain-containing protein [Lichenicoccus sp.]|uniref:MaoC family dehydratase N-terminal domain-containing protein n=1 Tax=Lichenicoccus sp. TaxID=2781899 RepID=UPI003D112846
MIETTSVAVRKGIFDRTAKGVSSDPVTIQIERGRIRFFAEVLGAADPIHSDVAAARAKGYPDLVAPPSFFTVLDAIASEEHRRLGRTPIATLIGCDNRYLLHGEEQYDYAGPMFAGDQVTLTTTVVDFYDKKGGTMEFVTLQSVVEHAARGTLVKATRNLLHRLG